MKRDQAACIRLIDFGNEIRKNNIGGRKMPWCPKCKNEYVEGTKECVSCKVQLVEKLEERKSITFGEAGEMERLKDFLEYNQIENVEVIFNGEDSTYELCVEKEDEKQAKKLTSVFLREEAAKAEEADEEENGAPEAEKYTVYQNNATKAEDNKSSAFTLLIVGGIGIFLIILCMTGVITLSLSATSKYMVYGVMGALFTLFIIMGIVSLRSYKIFAQKAQKEDSLTEEIVNWCLADLSGGTIDQMIWGGEDGKYENAKDNFSEEMKYFKRTEKMKELINEKFLNLDEAYLEHILDDIYTGIYDKNCDEKE